MASGGALSYLTVEPPKSLSYGPPAVSSDWIGNLPNDFQQGQQYGYQRNLQTLFRPGTPGGNALASGDTGQLFQLLAQAGGAPVVQQLLPQMLGAESSRAIMSGINGGGQLSALPTGGADPRNKIPVITAAAQKYGVDPAVALRVARSEGLADFYGDGGRSGTAFQLYTHGGLGNEFQKETGLDPLDPKNEDAAIDWAMRNVARTGWGPYKGAAKVGIGPRQGIGTASSSPGIDQQGTGPGPTAGTSAAESAQAGPQGAPAVEQPSGAIGNAPFMAGPPTPTNNVASGPANITLAQQQPAPAPTAAPGMDMARAQMLRDKQAKLQRASEAAAANPYSPKGFAERIQRDSDVAGEQAQRIEDFNAERSKQQYGVGIAQQTEQNKLDAGQYSALHKGLAGAGTVAANSVQYTQAAKGLLNDPGFYSGSGEGINLAWKRALAGLGLDPGGALPQEAFRKVMAANILQQVNALKAEAESMGQAGSRIFSSQIDMMEKAAQNPDNSIAANRYLTELAARSANRTMQIADAADDYAQSHKALDAGFEKQMRNWISKNPIFTPQEMAHPQLLSAPSAPPTVRSKEDLAAWGRSLGFKLGDPVRTPDGRLVPLP